MPPVQCSKRNMQRGTITWFEPTGMVGEDMGVMPGIPTAGMPTCGRSIIIVLIR